MDTVLIDFLQIANRTAKTARKYGKTEHITMNVSKSILSKERFEKLGSKKQDLRVLKKKEQGMHLGSVDTISAIEV